MLMQERNSGPYYGLKSTLDRKKKPQKELADLIGVTEVQINRKINRSGGHDFKLSEAVAIAKYLDIKINDFFG